jgi:GTP pyrophosphokinase
MGKNENKTSSIDFSQDFCSYLAVALKLKAKARKGSGNMFRHQMETFAILIEYDYWDSMLLKAAIIHDIVEDGVAIGFEDFEAIVNLDDDGRDVLALVKEVSRRIENGMEEPRDVFISRIMKEGSSWAKILKLADRISNLSSMQLTNDTVFISHYCYETETNIIPYAKDINSGMKKEMEQIIKKSKKVLK